MPLFLNADQKAARTRAEDARAEFDALRESDQPRLQRYRLHETEYESARTLQSWQIADDDYGRKSKEADTKRHHIPLPYGHAITTKHAFRVAGRMPDISCPRLDASPPERYRADTKEKLVYASYGASKAEVQFMSGATDGSLHGAACFDLYWSERRQLPIFRSISPGGIVVVPGVDDPHVFKRVYRYWRISVASFRAEYKGVELPGGQTANDVRADEGAQDVITMVETTDGTSRLRFADNVFLESYEDSYGFVPYVVIPNLGPIRKLFGYSDYEFYRGLVRYYETALSRQADVLRGAAGGAYGDDGSGQNASTVQRILRTGGILPMRPGSKVTPLEVAKQPDFTEAHLADVKTALKELSFSPDAAWGTLGAATSGTDRALQIAPQVELTALKQIHWTAGLQRLNAMILQLIEERSTGTTKYRGRHGERRTPFTITLNAASTELEDMLGDQGQTLTDPTTGEAYRIPSSPKDLIDGDYETDVKWQRRLERDDPQWVLSRLNLFSQGALSLYTLLDDLGFESPEDEIKRIESEAERFPWMRQGMIELIKQQLAAQSQQSDPSAQGQNPGGGGDIAGALGALAAGGGGQSGALNFDAMSQGLNGSVNSGGQGQGSVPGAPYGGA